MTGVWCRARLAAPSLAAPSRHRSPSPLHSLTAVEPHDIALRWVGDVRGEIEGTMQPSSDADIWRKRAEKARATAEAMTAPSAKRDMQLIAAAYERLADHAERTAKRLLMRPSD